MKIGIFGGLGYIGSSLVNELFYEHELVIGDNVSYICDPKWMDWMHLRDNIDFRFMDVKDDDAVSKMINDCDKIVNLSALVGEPICKPNEKDAYEINQTCANKISDKCNEYGKKLVFLSTCSNYGSTKVKCDEESPLDPLGVYSKTKVGAENHIIESNPDATILRMSTVFGASESRTRMDIIPNQFLKEAIEKRKISIFEPDAIRPIIHVSDAVNVIKTMLEGNPEHRVYNVGFHDMNITKEKMANTVSRMTGAEVVLVDSDDKRTYTVDFSRLHNEFDIPHGFNLEYGLRHLLDEIDKKKLPLTCGNI